MNEQCPTCKRRFKDEDDLCLRCGTDLQQIKKIWDCFETNLSIGRNLLRQDAIQAEQYLRRALQINPGSYEARKALALALALQNLFKEALSTLVTMNTSS